MRSRSNWTLEVLVFKERGKLEYLEKNLLEERREQKTNSTHIWRWRQDSNPGHTGGDECSHHCTTLAPWVFSWVCMLHYTFTCYDLYALLLNELLTLCMVFFSGYECRLPYFFISLGFFAFCCSLIGDLHATTVNVILSSR